MRSLEDIILPILLKDYLVYAIYFLFLTTLLLFVILVIHKTYVERRERRREELIDLYRRAIGDYLGGDHPALNRPSKRIEYDAFSEACVNLLSQVGEAKTERIRMLLKENSVVDFYRRMAYSRSWTKRFYGIETLGLYRLYELRNLFIDILNNDPVREVRAKALWGLSLIADEDVLWIITRRLATGGISRSSKFNEYIYTNAINTLKEKGLGDRFVEFLKRIKDDGDIPVGLKKDIISATGVSGLREAVGVMDEYIQTYPEDPLMRVACIRALGLLGGLGKERMIEGLSHSDWRVRAVTAGAISGDVDGEVINSLRQVLYDQAYFVRLNAARALSRLGREGISVLEQERDSNDRFVQDVARYLLQEANIHV